MLKKREYPQVITAVLFMSLILSMFDNSLTADLKGVLNYFLILFYSIAIICTAIVGKKITANYLNISIEHKIWEWRRWWFWKKAYFKKPIPMGLVFPLITTFFANGLAYFKALTFLQFESTPLPGRALKKRRKATWNSRQLASPEK